MDEIQVVAFTLGKEQLAIPIDHVKEIINSSRMTSIPTAECHVQGVINLRGKNITVINLASKLGLNSTTENTIERKIVIVDHNETVVGFQVDTVSEVLKIPSEAIEQPYLMANTSYMSGIGKINERLILLLNVDTLVA